jgi:hypothetical protein
VPSPALSDRTAIHRALYFVRATHFRRRVRASSSNLARTAGVSRGGSGPYHTLAGERRGTGRKSGSSYPNRLGFAADDPGPVLIKPEADLGYAGDRIFGVSGRGQGEFQLCRVRTASHDLNPVKVPIRISGSGETDMHLLPGALPEANACRQREARPNRPKPVRREESQSQEIEKLPSGNFPILDAPARTKR